MRRFGLLAGVLVFIAAVFLTTAATAQSPLVSGIGVTGNAEVVDEHILSVVGTEVGEPLDRDQLQGDIDAIYELGFFSLVDVSVSPQAGGAYVEFEVVENPVVEKVEFTGNTVFTDVELMEVLFTRPGAVFNRTFFRHDLQRVVEKYEKAGYSMVRIEDVQVEGGTVNVQVAEPVVGDIIIQGNTKTKTHVIEREILLEKGDLFSTTLLRYSMTNLNRLEFFEDINLGFEPSEEDPAVVNLVFTITEKRTTRLGLSVGHGSSSGWSGGATYTETNYRGLGHRAEIGFETGDREQYWLTYTEPYMDQKHHTWKAGIYRRQWEDLEEYESGTEQYIYDEEKTGFYAGIGKKFRSDERLSWYALADWHEVEISNVREPDGTVVSGDLTGIFDEEDLIGTNYSITGTLSFNNTTRYIPYPEGEVYSLNVEQGLFEPDQGEDKNYTKYWLEARYYLPLKDFLGGFVDLEIGSEDDPVIFAARLRYGLSSGSLPWSEQYFLGGANTLRGYRDDEFEGDEMFLGNFELRLPVQDAFSLVVFYDTGLADNEFSFSDLEDAFGFGVRVRTPLGNLRLDVAEGAYETRTHFGFGEMF
ncbi:MAG: BamA/OMP85 family outer membrane protein [Thermovirgaceae bacterium]